MVAEETDAKGEKVNHADFALSDHMTLCLRHMTL